MHRKEAPHVRYTIFYKIIFGDEQMLTVEVNTRISSSKLTHLYSTPLQQDQTQDWDSMLKRDIYLYDTTKGQKLI